MKKLTHEEILKQKPSIEQVKRKKRNNFYALLENVRSLHNVGSIFRTSDAVLLKKLYLCGFTGFPPRKEISKTALGAEELVPFEHYDDPIEIIDKLKKKGVKIAAVEIAHDSRPYDQVEFGFPTCFIFGHEVEGISDKVMEKADIALSVPMSGRANSLNVSVCYGIIMYEALKQLKK